MKTEIYLHTARKQNPPQGMLCLRFPDLDAKMVFTSHVQSRQGWTAAIQFFEKFTRKPYPVPKEIADYLHPQKGNANGKDIQDHSRSSDPEARGGPAIPSGEGQEPSLAGNPAGASVPEGGIIVFPGANPEGNIPSADGG